MASTGYILYTGCSSSAVIFSHWIFACFLKPSVDQAREILIEIEQRIRQAVRGIKEMFRKDGLVK